MSNNDWSIETAEGRVESCLTRVANDAPKDRYIFSSVFPKPDHAALKSKAPTALSGALVSVKALCDVKGEITHSGTQFLAETPAATADAPAIANLREAGALLIGHTNMSELAYSGIGLNPHYGTADNPLWPGHVPGGSTSGGAVSVANGLVDIAIGSDTGGSLRIPAAFCGITGFKPSQQSVSRAGTGPLSDTLDCIGPMAKTVEGCAQAWQIMAGLADAEMTQDNAAPLSFHISRNFGFDGLDPIIAEGFESLITDLAKTGVSITDKPLAFLESYGEIAPWHLTSVECRAHYEKAFQTQAELFDQRVHSRMARADELSAVKYRKTLNKRQRFVEAMSQALAGRVLLLPTVAILPPTVESLQEDEAFYQQNLLALRNTTLANIGDGCSLAMPYEYKGVTLSLMLVGANGMDVRLLEVGKQLEAYLR